MTGHKISKTECRLKLSRSEYEKMMADSLRNIVKYTEASIGEAMNLLEIPVSQREKYMGMLRE